MTSKTRTPERINSQPPHTPEGEHAQDKWKTSPSTEVTADQGENARIERERKQQENAPLLPPDQRPKR
jgi:hypothetical protein